ncbi:MAG: hypothetical protein Q4E41_07810 [Bacteroidales bacterium]|nr:hypothetical protein [Bacteroidales bacterium]
MRKKLLLLAGSLLAGFFTSAHAEGTTLYDAYKENSYYFYEIFAAQNITDDLSGVVAFQKGGVHYLLVRDQGNHGVEFNYTDLSKLGSDVKFYNIAGHDQREYTQTNYLLLHSGKLNLSAYAGLKIQNIKAEGNVNKSNATREGSCDEDAGYGHGTLGILTHRVDYITPGSGSTTTAINTYCPANFTGSDLVEGTYEGVTSKYFFMKPKQYEFAHIVYAEYNGNDAFVTPAQAPGVNLLGFKGGFCVQWDLYEGGKPELTEGDTYEFDAVIFYKPHVQGVWGIGGNQPFDCGCECKLCTKYYEHHNDGDCCNDWGWGAPKKAKTVHSHGENVSVDAEEGDEPADDGISKDYIVYPVNISKPIVTSVDEVSAVKELASVKYVNLQGQVSAIPFDGVNIQVSTYTDGSTHTVKIMK